MVMLVETSIDFLFLESVASEVFIVGVLFCGAVYHSLLLRPLAIACHQSSFKKLYFDF